MAARRTRHCAPDPRLRAHGHVCRCVHVRGSQQEVVIIKHTGWRRRMREARSRRKDGDEGRKDKGDIKRQNRKSDRHPQTIKHPRSIEQH